MLLVKTTIKPSPIHGVGIFAAQFIAQGTVIWQFMLGFDLKLLKEDILKLSLPVQEQVLKYAYLDGKLNAYILCSDDARFFNHSTTPNTREEPFEDGYNITIASKDINAGEEMTCNYYTFDAECDYSF